MRLCRAAPAALLLLGLAGCGAAGFPTPVADFRPPSECPGEICGSETPDPTYHPSASGSATPTETATRSSAPPRQTSPPGGTTTRTSEPTGGPTASRPGESPTRPADLPVGIAAFAFPDRPFDQPFPLEPPPEPAPLEGPRSALIVVLAIAVLLAVAALLVVALRGQRARPEPAR